MITIDLTDLDLRLENFRSSLSINNEVANLTNIQVIDFYEIKVDKTNKYYYYEVNAT